ncbi:transmembrane protein 272-like isoform X2 [Panulirus ornatus]|uniref:transmembrane protein 272-like isoform X2 n=1 Tax=Panulirus ornatus TaxID=150431 RepID=UPI003A83C6E2
MDRVERENLYQQQITTTDGIPPPEEPSGPPPAYSFQPQRITPIGSQPGPPPSYDECHNLNVPPPTYDSLFGRVREVQKTSNGVVDFVKNLIILFMGTIGCTVMIGVTIVIPVFMIIVGSLKMDACPAEPYIPIYLVVGGTFGVVKNLLSFQGRLHRPLAEEDEGGEGADTPTPWHRRLQFTGSINFFLTVWFILGCFWVYRIYEPSYNSDSVFYCDYTLYQFAFWLLTSVYIAAGLLTSCMCCLSVATVVMQHSRLSEAQV